jgi:hypothetical protein
MCVYCFFLNKEKRVKMKCLPVSARMGLTLQSVRNVISGSPDQETDPIRALIGGACRVWQWAPSHAAPQ